MAAFAQWLTGFLDTFVTWIYNAFIDLFQIIFNVMCDFAYNLLLILPTKDGVPPPPPDSKVTWSEISELNPVNLYLDPAYVDWFTGKGGSVSSTIFNVFMDTLNWLAPIGYVYEVAKFSTMAILIYVCIAPVLRWFKILT